MARLRIENKTYICIIVHLRWKNIKYQKYFIILCLYIEWHKNKLFFFLKFNKWSIFLLSFPTCSWLAMCCLISMMVGRVMLHTGHVRIWSAAPFPFEAGTWKVNGKDWLSLGSLVLKASLFVMLRLSTCFHSFIGRFS